MTTAESTTETATEVAAVDGVVAAAVAAGAAWATRSRAERARVLRLVADALDAHVDELVVVAGEETHLPEPRLRGEVARTSFQLRLLAGTVADGGHLDARIDHADPDWPMGARPDLRRTRIPLGPVVVFAASNFPFAFSVVGGDTASALAAGCAVVLKAHPGHPRLSAATGRVVQAALDAAGAPRDLLQVISGQDAGIAALTHPAVRAGAFTGSIAGGRALFDLACSRPEPIPFYGELGSVNPVFVTAAADRARGADVATELVGSFTLGAGQFCTKPGVVHVPRNSAVRAALSGTDLPGAAPMLNDTIAAGYRRGLDELLAHPDVQVLAGAGSAGANPPAPTVLLTDLAAVQRDPELLAERFGPAVLLVEYADQAELVAAAAALEGQLTATLIAEDDEPDLADLTAALADRAGRVLWNQWPTGVSVTHAQQHGGPYPATTAAGTTSVGTAAVDRFTRPVAYQGFPQHLLPVELRDGDPAVPVRIDGELSLPAGTAG